MKTPSHFARLFLLGLFFCCLTSIKARAFQPAAAEVQSRETVIVDSAPSPQRGHGSSREGYSEVSAGRAQGIAIMPGRLKGGSAAGIVTTRGDRRGDDGGGRRRRVAAITGGSFGWQVGVQAADIVLVFKTKTSVESLMKGKFTLGGGVAAAAGPVGRQAEAGTDARLKAEIFSYSRSRGLFGDSRWTVRSSRWTRSPTSRTTESPGPVRRANP